MRVEIKTSINDVRLSDMRAPDEQDKVEIRARLLIENEQFNIRWTRDGQRGRAMIPCQPSAYEAGQAPYDAIILKLGLWGMYKNTGFYPGRPERFLMATNLLWSISGMLTAGANDYCRQVPLDSATEEGGMPMDLPAGFHPGNTTQH